MHRHLPRIAVAATAVVATVGLGAGTAVAATGTSGATAPASTTTGHHHKGDHAAKHGDAPLPANPTLAQVQAAAKVDIGNRVTDLQKALAKVDKAKGLGAAQPALASSLQSQITGLNALGTKIAGDTDLTTAKADFATIFTTYRVYDFELPRARLVAADARIANASGTRLSKVTAKIKAKETPANQAEVAPLLADAATQLSAATKGVSGQIATLETYTPASYNANKDVLKTAKTATKASVADLKKAVSDAKQAAADVGLHSHKGHGHHHAGATGTPTTGTTSAA